MSEYRIVDMTGVTGEDVDSDSFDLEALPQLPCAYFDGYGPFDRELEDVMIKVVLSKDKTQISISEDGFPSHLRFDHYKDGLLEYALQNDLFEKEAHLNCDSAMIIKRKNDNDSWKFAYEDWEN